jgi:2-hydroxychromene-2-carboxylate isomerase
MSAPLTVDVFFSSRSPYSYIATPRLVEFQKKYNLKVRLRPVLPLIVRTPEFFAHVNPLLVNYIQVIDAPRVAEHLGLPFIYPNPDPVAVHRDSENIPRMDEMQPNIHRLTYLCALAEERGHGIQFAKETSSLIFGGTKDWHLGSHLAEATKRAGLDLEGMDKTLESEEERKRLDVVIKENQEALTSSGHWGVPTCVFNGEPFYGQDRLELLIWRLKQHGLVDREGD